MNIGFLTNQIDNRGTGNAVYNYAHYNEEILGNKSKIYTFQNKDHSPIAFEKFVNRFGEIYLAIPENIDVDALYHIKSGENDGFNPDCPYLVHSVFKPQVHGTRYATISEWMGIRHSLPVVPHIVTLADNTVNFRSALKIPEDAVVFGRHGGLDSFDIPFAWEAIWEALKIRDDLYFLFLNTWPRFDEDHPRIMHFPATVDENAKRAFLNTCDAMLHARSRGETFGISVGEFSMLGKPIFTYGGSYEKAHIYELKGTAKTYLDKEELIQLLLNYNGEKSHPFYDKFDPERVMEQFKEVFLD